MIFAIISFVSKKTSARFSNAAKLAGMMCFGGLLARKVGVKGELVRVARYGRNQSLPDLLGAEVQGPGLSNVEPLEKIAIGHHQWRLDTLLTESIADLP